MMMMIYHLCARATHLSISEIPVVLTRTKTKRQRRAMTNRTAYIRWLSFFHLIKLLSLLTALASLSILSSVSNCKLHVYTTLKRLDPKFKALIIRPRNLGVAVDFILATSLKSKKIYYSDEEMNEVELLNLGFEHCKTYFYGTTYRLAI